MSPEQYLEIERPATMRSDYRNGQMLPTAGAAKCITCWFSISRPLCISDLEHATAASLRPRYAFSTHRTAFTYPDAAACRGELRYADAHKDTLLNSSLIAEVLSPSTEAYDRGRKFEHYRKIDSLQEYLLIAQDRIHTELYTRQPGGSWNLTEASASDTTIALKSIACTLMLPDLYENVPFETSAS